MSLPFFVEYLQSHHSPLLLQRTTQLQQHGKFKQQAFRKPGRQEKEIENMGANQEGHRHHPTMMSVESQGTSSEKTFITSTEGLSRLTDVLSTLEHCLTTIGPALQIHRQVFFSPPFSGSVMTTRTTTRMTDDDDDGLLSTEHVVFRLRGASRLFCNGSIYNVAARNQHSTSEIRYLMGVDSSSARLLCSSLCSTFLSCSAWQRRHVCQTSC